MKKRPTRQLHSQKAEIWARDLNNLLLPLDTKHAGLGLVLHHVNVVVEESVVAALTASAERTLRCDLPPVGAAHVRPSRERNSLSIDPRFA